MTEKSIIDLMIQCTSLKHIDIYDHKISGEGRRCMIDIAKPRGSVFKFTRPTPAMSNIF
jgi:hypothetical protein